MTDKELTLQEKEAAAQAELDKLAKENQELMTQRDAVRAKMKANQMLMDTISQALAVEKFAAKTNIKLRPVGIESEEAVGTPG